MITATAVKVLEHMALGVLLLTSARVSPSVMDPHAHNAEAVSLLVYTGEICPSLPGEEDWELEPSRSKGILA